ncbi:hypothetical protein F4820DRAFT_454023 [Hypoxylon rubiginosum]|uniref:Uncharacterized protein n=1 Tax=Hypoxylon rubiginosum TaxID=110542 RepID=A0ACB9YJJ4_9PEZI|nr:hypothetical protein F4820DRAFT_454023 [Hypoxylon rubiginosum]
MSHQTTLLSSTAGARRSSIASETTLVDTSSRKMYASKEKDQDKDDDRKLSLDAGSTHSQASGSSRASMMEKAIKKVKSKLGEKGSTSTSEAKPKPKQSTTNMYPDTVYMWRALAETKM